MFLLLGLLAPLPSFAARDSRPFWTEKSAFIEGEDLFVVGVTTNAKTPEEGRQLAFQHGIVELMNYAQVTSLEAHGLVIETQMTYEEANLDGTVTVFRLLLVPVNKLRAIQGRLQAQSKAQEQTLEQTRRELVATQQSLTQKQRELETRAREIEETMKSISLLQVTVGEKALKIEQQQRQVEDLLKQVSAKIRGAMIEGDTAKAQTQSRAPSTKRGVLEKKLKQAEAALDEEERELRKIAARAKDRIEKQSQSVQVKCKYLHAGMTRDEVQAIMGTPDYGFHEMKYGTREPVEIRFNDAGGISRIWGCDAHPFRP